MKKQISRNQIPLAHSLVEGQEPHEEPMGPPLPSEHHSHLSRNSITLILDLKQNSAKVKTSNTFREAIYR